MKVRLAFSGTLLLACGLVGIACGRGGPAFTDPAAAGPDFQVQGEYVGELKVGDETKKIGLQVVALGKHEFTATAYHGGLPGEGWSRGDKIDTAKGKTEGDATVLRGDKGTATIKGDTVTCVNTAGEPMGELKKVQRKSPTLGAAPPSGAIVLFDGTSTDAWHNGKIVEDKLLWIGPTSKQKFGDFTLHLEFRIPYMPEARGQARGNSGVYLQHRYEVQVLDSFGLEGKNDDCGGFYKIAPEAVNMSFPPLTWQTYDIDFTAARFDADGKKTQSAHATVRQNGVLVHDNVELPHPTPGQLQDEKVAAGQTVLQGPLYLQDHGGDPVVFRNVWVVEKK